MLNSISSHATFGRLTPHLQGIRPYHLFKGSDLLNQEASNAFPPFHYWKPCPTKRYYPAILNFYRYLSCISRKCHTNFAGIRAVFTDNHYASKLYNDYEYTEKRSGARFLHLLQVGWYPLPLHPNVMIHEFYDIVLKSHHPMYLIS